MSIRTYRMTISSTWYDKKDRGAKEYELHFTVARRGKIRTIRSRLAGRGVEYFQRKIYSHTKTWIPKRKVKVRFEREISATIGDNIIRIEGRNMLYRGKRWFAYTLGTGRVNYAKKKKH